MHEVEKKILANFQILGPLGCQGWVVIPQNVKKSQNHCTLIPSVPNLFQNINLTYLYVKKGENLWMQRVLLSIINIFQYISPVVPNLFQNINLTYCAVYIRKKGR